VYLLYLDESGTHGNSTIFVLAGLAVHERDAWHLQNRIERVLTRRLPPGLVPQDFELHAADMKSPRRATAKRAASEWLQVPIPVRMRIMSETYAAITTYQAIDPDHPVALFGAVVARDGRSGYEERAYEEVLHKFDELLTRQAHRLGTGHETGIVIHDRRVVERAVQRRTERWRHVRGRLGTLTHLADVPFFADSRASRLLQAADFVNWALQRFYGPLAEERRVQRLWSHFDADRGVMHGLIHVHRGYRTCACPPCVSRRTATAN
jgi:Protein of unknown function (DUF3800)